jgi:hypothetical protein
LCREHGRQIVQLAAELEENDRIVLPYWGIVKELEADPTGLAEFQALYFNNAPLYRDMEMQYYEAFGNQSINLLPYWNPFRLYQWFRDIAKRLSNAKIDGNLKGEGMVMGGLLLFVDGELRYAQDEMFGDPLDTESLKQIIRQFYPKKSSSKTTHATTTAATTTASDNGATNGATTAAATTIAVNDEL